MNGCTACLPLLASNAPAVPLLTKTVLWAPWRTELVQEPEQLSFTAATSELLGRKYGSDHNCTKHVNHLTLMV